MPNRDRAEVIQSLHGTLEGHSQDPLAEQVKHARQLRLIGPTNNGKSHLARCVAQLWVASGDASSGRWIETTIKMTTMEEHLWAAREDSGDGVHREVWGPLKYLWELAKANEDARFALILNESNRGGLFNILNAVWWEARRSIGVELDPARDPPANLALIFTENPATADYSVVGGDDEALNARLGEDATWAVVHGGVRPDARDELGVMCAHKFIDMCWVGKNFAFNHDRELQLPPGTKLEHLPAGKQLREVMRLPRRDATDGDEDMSNVHEVPSQLLPEASNSSSSAPPLPLVGTNGLFGCRSLWRLDNDDRHLVDDEDFVFNRMASAGRELEAASERLRDNSRVVLRAVQTAGTALKFASARLKGDEEIVLAAVKSIGSSLRYADSRYR